MKSCKHGSWLSLHGKEKIVLRYASTLNDITTSLDTPASKTPSLVVMLGDAGKGKFLDDVLSTTRRREDNQDTDGLFLRQHPGTAFSDHPMLIAYENISRRSTFMPEPMAVTCHRQTVRELQWQIDSLAEAMDNLYSRLLRPFTDVVCFFSAESDEIHHQIDRMIPWLKQISTKVPLCAMQPRLLLIAAPHEQRSEASMEAHVVGLLEERLKRPVSDLLSCISVYVKHRSSQTIMDRIKRETDIARNAHARDYTILNAVHFDLLFRQACEHFVSTRQDSFDMVAASRLHRPVSAALQIYLAGLFTSVDSYEDMADFVAPFVAGCLAMDHYAHDVPFFDPGKVFSVHYRSPCLNAAENRLLRVSKQQDNLVLLLRTQLVSLIEQRFLERSKALHVGQRSTLLTEFQPWLAVMKPHKVCLACVQAVPEHKFPCGHMVCERCFMDLGHHAEVDPHLHEIDSCPFCAVSLHVTLRVKPVTAGFRVLSIDGGGIRAAIPIQFLCALEKAVGLGMPIQEHFDLGYGTSSGAMVILALYGLGLRAEETFVLFKQLSTRIFRGRNQIGIGFAAAAHALVASCRNGRFPASDIDDALSEIFNDATMLDHRYMSSIGARTGFPVIDADTLETCLVTSYNGAARGRSDRESKKKRTYKVLRSEGATGEIRMKDAARCTSAAPWYFTPHKMPHHGTFMDGGLSDNNPCMLAMQELQGMAPELRRADQFVSIGTGTCSKKEDTREDTYPSLLFGNSSLQQTFRHYWSENFDGDKRFAIMRQMMAVTLPDGAAGIDEWLHRFNLPVDGELPDLADAPAIPSLAEKACSYFSSDPAVRDLADAILASSFYFELRSMPIYEQGYYSCHGRILCRVPGTKPAFSVLMRKLDSLGAQFHVHMRMPGPSKSMSTWLDQAGNFSRPVCLRVPSLEDQLDVRLKLQGSRTHHISASPLSFNTLIKLQMLEWSALRNFQSTTTAVGKKRLSTDCSSRVVKRRRLEAK